MIPVETIFPGLNQQYFHLVFMDLKPEKPTFSISISFLQIDE
jgi:hypothetical protein